jgi:DICT domain-containing protein
MLIEIEWRLSVIRDDRRAASMTDALYYRQQAERFARVADQCTIPYLVPYYRQLAADYTARADRAAAGVDPSDDTAIDLRTWELAPR